MIVDPDPFATGCAPPAFAQWLLGWRICRGLAQIQRRLAADCICCGATECHYHPGVMGLMVVAMVMVMVMVCWWCCVQAFGYNGSGGLCQCQLVAVTDVAESGHGPSGCYAWMRRACCWGTEARSISCKHACMLHCRLAAVQCAGGASRFVRLGEGVRQVNVTGSSPCRPHACWPCARGACVKQSVWTDHQAASDASHCAATLKQSCQCISGGDAVLYGLPEACTPHFCLAE